MQDTLFTARIPVTSTDLPTTLKIHIALKSNTLELKLISTTNLFTFYLCTISPGDFSVTKREQGIKVDFQTFTKTLVNYFQSIIENDMAAICDTIDDSKIRFTFVENNAFKNLTRLELIFYKPGEHEFKKYLAEMITKFENDNVKLARDLKMAKETLASAERRAKEKLAAVESDCAEMKHGYDRIYMEKAVAEDEVDRLKKEAVRLEKKVIECEKKIGDYEFESEKMRIAEIKSGKEREMIGKLKERLEGLEADLEARERSNKKLREDIKNLKIKEQDLEDIKAARKDEGEKNRKERDETKKKVKRLESLITDLKGELAKISGENEKIRHENRELAKKLENSQSVYNYFYKKKTEKGGSNESDESSLFSTLQPETPPRKEL